MLCTYYLGMFYIQDISTLLYFLDDIICLKGYAANKQKLYMAVTVLKGYLFDAQDSHLWGVLKFILC